MNHANIMRGYREKYSYTQPQMAKALNTSQSYISKVEKGVAFIPVDMLEVIYFDITGKPLVADFLQLASVGFVLLESERAKRAENKKKKLKKKPQK